MLTSDDRGKASFRSICRRIASGRKTSAFCQVLISLVKIIWRIRRKEKNKITDLVCVDWYSLPNSNEMKE